MCKAHYKKHAYKKQKKNISSQKFAKTVPIDFVNNRHDTIAFRA